jgi:PAS domain S-box-containing protein
LLATLVGGPLLAVAGAFLGLALAPVVSPGFVIAGVLLPTITIVVLGIGLVRPRFLIVAAVLLNVEALAAAAMLPAGIAVAVVLPMISIALVQNLLRMRPLLWASFAAAAVATVGVALAVLVGPAQVLFAGTSTPVTIGCFTALVAFALALDWRATNSVRTALDAAQAEIAARNAAEARLERTSKLLNAIVDESPLAVQAFTLDRIVTIWNPASERIFGWTADELIGRPMPIEMVPEDERASSAERIQRTIAGEVARGDRVRRITKDGRQVWVEIYGSVLRDDDGRPQGLAGQLADVTERMTIDAQLAHAERLEAIGRVAGGIAHDFNNTLTAIGGFATLIGQEADDPEAVRADAETIHDVVHRSRQLTRQLLAFSRRTTLEPTIVDLRSTVGAIRPMVDRLVEGAVTVEVREPDHALIARVDAGQLEQALVNLAINARDAMPDGGALTIEIRRVRLAAGDIPDDPDAAGPFVAIAVTDTGSGMPDDVAARVFEPFFTTKEAGRGTGLGLAMVRDFMRQSGGFVRLATTSGAGTTVELLLPEVIGLHAETEPDPAPAARPEGTESILVVDDEPAVAAFARRALSDLGYSVCVEHNVQGAVNHLQRCPCAVDLLLSDIVLPDGSGTEIADAVREARPGTRTLFVCGYTADALADRGVRVDGLDVLGKPYDGVELATRVRLALDVRPGGPGSSQPSAA